MICWIASYPRCGNTLTVQIMTAVFGATVYTTNFKELKQRFDNRLSEIACLNGFDGAWEDFYEKACNSDKLIFIKTHDHPIDNNPAIVVTRDGRASCSSYYHFQKQYFTETNPTLLDIILGNVAYQDWSSFYTAWSPFQRPNTLLLRFDDLKLCYELVTSRLSEFLNIPVKAKWVDNFEKNARIVPGFFRKGTLDSWKEDFKDDELRVFWAIHTEWMEEFGYLKSEADIKICQSPFDNPSSTFKTIEAMLRSAQNQVISLQKVCDERLALIQQLDSECQKRLEVIQQQALHIQGLEKILASKSRR